MSEALTNTEKQPKPIEDFETSRARTREEQVQFSDGEIGLLIRTKGDRIEWGDHKYNHVEDPAQFAVVKTSNGNRFAFGRGVSVMLPELDNQTGRLSTEGPKTGARFEHIAPDGLPDVTIGEPWSVLGNQGAVESVMLRYKVTTPGDPSYAQIDMPSYFEDVVRQIYEAESKLPH